MKTNKPDKYQQAFEEWDKRIGSAKAQAKSWRFACFITLIVVICLVLCIGFLLTTKKNYVYVAKVGAHNQITNVVPLNVPYTPSDAEKEHFIGKFISSIMSLPLDPVVARQNWLYAYSIAAGKANMQLTHFARSEDPFTNIGQITKTVKFLSFHPIGNNSYSFSWDQTIYDVNGKISKINLYNGIFTVYQSKQPRSLQELLQNPLGLKIAYFTFNNQGY